MTYKEFGLKLRQRWPKLNEVDLSHEDLARRVVKDNPQLLDLLSPTARKIHETSQEPVYYPGRRWFEGSTVEVENEGKAIANRQAYLQSLHAADMMIEASVQRIPVTALHDIAVLTHQTEETMRLERFRRDNGLDGADRVALKPHQLMRILQNEINDLIDEHDAEPHPRKKKNLDTLIAAKEEELRARGQQIVVQAGGRPRLELADKNPNGGGSTESGSETDSDAVPIKDTGAGKRRVGFSS